MTTPRSSQPSFDAAGGPSPKGDAAVDSAPLPDVLGAQATIADLHHAYRLLLGREPDAAGWAELSRSLIEHPMRPDVLARGFLESPEFASRLRGDMPRDGRTVEIALEGFSVFVRSDDRDIGRHIRALHEYEPHVTAALCEALGPGQTFVDVGANIGYFTNLAAHRVGASGCVVAVEPLDKNVQLILRALEHNKFEHVRVNSCAASDRSGRVRIVTDPGTSNGQPLANDRADERTLFAQALRLDDLTKDLGRIDLAKFDIEGFELLAWRGFQVGLAAHRPNVLTEFHPYCMRTFVGIEPREYLDELFAYGGAIQVLKPDGRRIRCRVPDDVMQQWEIANRAAEANGRYHLDLYIQTR